jgi:hypothetical protein
MQSINEIGILELKSDEKVIGGACKSNTKVNQSDPATRTLSSGHSQMERQSQHSLPSLFLDSTPLRPAIYPCDLCHNPY